MRDFIKSTLRFSWAMSLFGVQQLENLAEDSSRQGDKTVTAFDSLTQATEGQLGGAVKDAFESGHRLQSRVVDAVFGALPGAGRQPQPSRPAANPAGSQPNQPPSAGSADSMATAYPVNRGRLNTSTFVVLGEGLAAGMGDFTLSDATQVDSFPARMARQMQTQFPQPLIQSPGIGNPVGFSALPVIVPAPMQTTVLGQLPPARVNNLSVPGYKLPDALNLRPSEPLIQRDDPKRTAANLILGVIPIAYGEEGRLPTQLECALNRQPTFTLLELGYYEALEAAVKADPGQLPNANSFRTDYAKLLKSLKDAGSEVLVLTVPDPFDTAHFSPINLAAKILKLDASTLQSLYKLKADDLITPNGLSEIAIQLLSRRVGQLPEGCVVSGEINSRVSRRVNELNTALAALAGERGALVYDLHAFFRRVRNEGIAVGPRRLAAEYLGGFYSLNGYYPGATGHALIANELLHQLNIAYGSDFRQVDLQAVMQDDPVAAYRQAGGPDWPAGQLSQPPPQPRPQTSVAGVASASGAAVRAPTRDGRGVSGWEALGQPQGVSPTPLRLPPGLEQVLPLSKAASYFGDAIRAVNCRDASEYQFGSCQGTLFGGFAMVNSHVSGSLRIRFSAPVNGVTHFEVTHGEGLVGDDGILSAPQFFRLASLQNSVQDVPGMVSSGDLNLDTGEVSNLTYYVGWSNTALLALASVNPRLPNQPIVFSTQSTPTQYGSAWARFEQRPDGLLDFSFYGSAFLPLGGDFQGEPVRFPLPFCGPALQFASVPGRGTALHPHLCLSTKEPKVSARDACPEIPFNKLQELTLFTHNSSFGDAFTLDSAQLGGGATGRSHVLGRVMLQFGESSGGYSVPVAVSLLNAGGVLAGMSPTPISQAFPGRFYPGPRGFDEFLRFPLRTYSLDDLEIIDDPFDISVGAVDLRTGRFLTQLLHRGFISQDLFFALLRIEPRTPQSSFFFRGPSVLEAGANGQLVFRFEGEVHIPYPEGFLFPEPNMATGFAAGPNSTLDPFLWIHAIQDSDAPRMFKQGGARHVLSSMGARFSYSYKLPSDPTRQKPSFEYENHSQEGKFRMHSLAWVGFGHSNSSGRASGEYDTVTFTGFGVWSKGGSHTVQQATVQISTSPQRPYVGIQIDGGNVSDVNTKPTNIKDALP
ncbi:MAG: hypothetical protein LC802_00895 [Acidobacteria bacterium]|nr:hypothetical protein [Acidobacteriota bacterium]